MKLNMIFFISSLVVLFYSCGFVNKGGPGSFQVASRGGAGDGETPTLKPRILDNPKLAEEDCEDNERCKETCRDMYPDSYKDCFGLNIRQVSNIENVFYALVNADSEELEDIDADHLEVYLKIGLDSWKERVIEKVGKKYTRFSNILKWIVNKEKDVIPLLEREDSNNEILEQIVLSYCNVKSDGRCENTDSANPYEATPTTNHYNFPTGSCALKITATKPSDRFPSDPDCGSSFCPALGSSYFADYSIYHVTTETESGVFAEGGRVFTYSATPSEQDKKAGVVFDYENDGGLYYCEQLSTQPLENCLGVTSDPSKSCTILTYKKLAEIEDDDNKELFMSLVGIGQVFFNHAANPHRPSAFALGHKLLEKACSSGNDDSIIQCMSVFYCWLNAHNNDENIASGSSSFLDDSNLQEKIQLRKSDLNSCEYSNRAFERI